MVPTNIGVKVIIFALNLLNLLGGHSMYQKMIIQEAGKSSEPEEKKEEEGDVEDKSQVTQVRV